MGGARIRSYLAQWDKSQQERMRCHICGPSLGHRQNCAQCTVEKRVSALNLPVARIRKDACITNVAASG